MKKHLQILSLLLTIITVSISGCNPKPEAGSVLNNQTQDTPIETPVDPEETATPENTKTPTETSTPTVTSTPAPTSTPTYTVATPNPGMSTVYGKVFWNSAPLADTDVKLCGNFNILDQCQMISAQTTTDLDGIYLFADIDPGEYVILVKIPQTEDWVYPTDNAGISAVRNQISANVSSDLGIMQIIRFDLQASSPKEGGNIAEARPVLDWEDYPDAVSYEIHAYTEGSTHFKETVTESSYTIPADMVNCKVTWMVKAFNSDGVQISEFYNSRKFYVTGQDSSCHLVQRKPNFGSSISGEAVQFIWDAHPRADHYEITITDADFNDIIKDQSVSETEFTLPISLEPGKYYWFLSAYQGTTQIANGESFEFTVK